MQEEIKKRTKNVALRIIKLVQTLDKNYTERVLGKQMLRSGTSIGANYRAACRAKSTADFINKLKIVEEETDETLYWLELLIEGNIVSKDKLNPLMKEINEILAIVVSSINTARRNKKK
jgi:four helix bundle protein